MHYNTRMFFLPKDSLKCCISLMKVETNQKELKLLQHNTVKKNMQHKSVVISKIPCSHLSKDEMHDVYRC